MAENTGVYKAYKKNGSLYYRASLTYRRKHISLGSYDTFSEANKAYTEARNILDSHDINLNSYTKSFQLPHNKFICLINYRDNGIYFPNPIYLYRQYFEYYLSVNDILKFDRDDLFFYASHKIQQRGGYLFVSDYGSQYKILNRYGIKPFAVYGRDYVMVNGDKNDYRYSNICILNSYIGVQRYTERNRDAYTALIHINGNYIIGRYDTEIEAAVAYNKAVDTLHTNGFAKAYLKNYIASMNKNQYRELYDRIKISDRLHTLTPQ